MDTADFLIRRAVPREAGDTRRVLVETWREGDGMRSLRMEKLLR